MVAEHKAKRDAARAARETAEDEMTHTKSRNSRLAADANCIKTRLKKPYKKPIAGKKDGTRRKRRMPQAIEYRVVD